MSLAEIVAKQQELERELASLNEEYGRKKADLEEQIRECERLRANAANGVDLEKLKLAESIIAVRGKLGEGASERFGVVEDAIRDIVAGAKRLRRYYFAVKDYAGLGDQREDHQYNFGPRYGDVVFSVKIKDERLGRLHNGEELTKEEVEACLYYLENLKRGNIVRKGELAGCRG